jgi:hypothetical protein
MSDDDNQITEPTVQQAFGERWHCGVRFAQKTRARSEVLDGVAGQRHFTDGKDVRASRGGFLGGLENLRCIAREIAENGVRLGECQAKSGHSH